MKQIALLRVWKGMREAFCESEAPGTAEAGAAVNLFARIGVQPQVRRCPICESIIYSRRHKLCGVCCGELPDECLFDPAQAESVSALIKEERAQHRTWMRRA